MTGVSSTWFDMDEGLLRATARSPCNHRKLELTSAIYIDKSAAMIPDLLTETSLPTPNEFGHHHTQRPLLGPVTYET